MNFLPRKYALIDCGLPHVICPEPVTVIIMPPFRRQIGKSRIYHSIIKQTAVFTDLLVLCPLYMLRCLKIRCTGLIRKSIESTSHRKLSALRIQKRQINGSSGGMGGRHLCIRYRSETNLQIAALLFASGNSSK